MEPEISPCKEYVRTEYNSQTPIKILTATAKNWSNVPEPGSYYQRPLMKSKASQTTSNDFSNVQAIYLQDFYSAREEGFMHRMKKLEEAIKKHSELILELHNTSNKILLLQRQLENQPNINSNLNNGLNLNNDLDTSASVSTQSIPKSVNVMNTTQQVNSSTAQGVKYMIIAEGTENNNEPIEIQLAEDDECSADSERLEICLGTEENVETNTECTADSRIMTSHQSVVPNPTEPTAPSVIVKNHNSATAQIVSTKHLSQDNQQQPQQTPKGTQVPTQGDAHIDLDNIAVPIGPNNTLVSAKVFYNVDWSSASRSTRKLLKTIFDRKILASHTMTGKASPAFKDLNKPVKQMLDPLAVSDIIHLVTARCNVSAKEVRNFITTTCADENKMMKLRKKKRALNREINKEN